MSLSLSFLTAAVLLAAAGHTKIKQVKLLLVWTKRPLFNFNTSGF